MTDSNPKEQIYGSVAEASPKEATDEERNQTLLWNAHQPLSGAMQPTEIMPYGYHQPPYGYGMYQRSPYAMPTAANQPFYRPPPHMSYYTAPPPPQYPYSAYPPPPPPPHLHYTQSSEGIPGYDYGMAMTPPSASHKKVPPPFSLEKIKASMPKKYDPPQRRIDGNKIIEEGSDEVYYMGCVALGVKDDDYWLSQLQAFLRKHFAEAFTASDEDVAAPMHGRNKPVVLGQVGIRCRYCKGEDPADRGQQSTSFPSMINGIYNSVQQMLRLHLDCCSSVPTDVRKQIESFKTSNSIRGGRKQYWMDSAKQIGLVDTIHGIHFGRDPYAPLPPLSGPSMSSKEGVRKQMIEAHPGSLLDDKVQKKTKVNPLTDFRRSSAITGRATPPPSDAPPLVLPEDRYLIMDHLYLTFEQMARCTLTEHDQVACYKTRDVGDPGLACRHCLGQAGNGRYFPATEASLSQTTTSQTIMNHVRACRNCPEHVREVLQAVSKGKMASSTKHLDVSNKPRHGGRKVFFHRLWCRIQGVDTDEEEEDASVPAGRVSTGKKKRKRSDDFNSPASSKIERKVSASRSKKSKRPWCEGCVRLSKSDDPNLLSSMECFARSELLEAFTLNDMDSSDGYDGRREPCVGQVGIRCIFCKDLDSFDRPNGCVKFPESLVTLHNTVADMIRLHFPVCPSMPDDFKEKVKALKGFDAKLAQDEEALAYWIDSARDIGLSDVPPEGRDTWGITFRRDPLQPSPVDQLDFDKSSDESFLWDSYHLVTPDDLGTCTDQTLFLLMQLRPCRFTENDRRVGVRSRGRDRIKGFPGLACMYCADMNSLGRYFPISAKNLTDTSSNTILAHVLSCQLAPEHIKASLAYLGHRTSFEKTSLKGSWKKEFYLKIWERLHSKSPRDGHGGGGHDRLAHLTNSVETSVSGDTAVEEEDTGENMNALITAAAIWLNERDDHDKTRNESRSTRSRVGV